MIKQLLNSVIAKYRDLSVSRRSIICLSLRLRQILDLLATDKSPYFAQPRPRPRPRPRCSLLYRTVSVQKFILIFKMKPNCEIYIIFVGKNKFKLKTYAYGIETEQAVYTRFCVTKYQKTKVTFLPQVWPTAIHYFFTHFLLLTFARTKERVTKE